MKSTRLFVIRSHCFKVHNFTKARLIGEGLYRSIPKDISEPEIFSCDFCDYKTTYKTQSESHRRTHTSERPFNCSQCPKKFTRKTLAKDHFLKAHKDAGEKRRFQCSSCSLSFVSEKSLSRHIKTYEIAEEEALFPCKECKHKLNSKAKLYRHMKYNHPTNPFNCTSCKFQSDSMRKLKLHKEAHSKELKQEKE